MRVVKLAGLASVLLLGALMLRAQTPEESLSRKYHDNWLNQDVLYIISDDERDVFSKLNTSEERDAFIEEFWNRRSAKPGGGNDYKEEHYRRVAYANTHFGSGIPGWKTDRGRIYIMFGEPAEIEYHAGGENYLRKPYEGGGRTTVYPFQVWRYRHIEGIGDDIEIEFVDQSWTGLYKISMNQSDKDMLLYQDGQGLTLSERLGLTNKAFRPGLHPGLANSTAMLTRYGNRSQDLPFNKMLQYFQLQRPPVIKQKELQSIVQTHVFYNTLPFKYTVNYIWMDSERVLAPITLEVDNSTLEFQRVFSTYKARVALYGAVTSLSGKIVAEFEDTIASEYSLEQFPAGKIKKSMYQRPLLLPAGLHKLDLVVKDLNSNQVGTISTSLNIPKPSLDRLAASPLVLAKMIQPMETLPDAPTSFLLGDLKVVPSVSHAFRPEDPLNVYFQVYNAAHDVAESSPRLETEYSILQEDKVLRQLSDKGGTSIEYASEQRTVMARRISLQGLEPGKYTLKIAVNDVITGQSLTRDAEFQVSAP